MAAVKFFKVATLPGVLQPSSFYYVELTGTTCEGYLTDVGGEASRIITGVPRYVHTQAVPASVWTINHNLGLQIGAVLLLSVGGMQMNADITIVSDNQVTINFSTPTAGSARIL